MLCLKLYPFYFILSVYMQHTTVYDKYVLSFDSTQNG